MALWQRFAGPPGHSQLLRAVACDLATLLPLVSSFLSCFVFALILFGARLTLDS